MHLPIPILRAALPHLRRTWHAKTTLPVLTACHIRRDFYGLHLTTTNLDQFTTVTHPNPDSIGLHPSIARLRALRHPVQEYIVELPALQNCIRTAATTGNLTFAPGACPGTVSISYPSKSNHTTTIPASDFPPIDFPFPPGTPNHTHHIATCDIPAPRLPAVLKDAMRFISRDESRYVLNGASWDGESIITTDGRRLFADDIDASCPTPIIIPTNACHILSLSHSPTISLLCSPPKSPDDPPLSPTSDPNHIAATWRDPKSPAAYTLTVRITSRLIDGRFPNWRQVVPDSNDFTLTMFFDRLNLRENLATILPHIKKLGSNGSVTLFIDHAKHTLRFQTNIPDHGTIAFTIPYRERYANVKALEYDCIAFNPEFFIDCLDSAGDTLTLVNHQTPGVFTTSAHPYRKMILMPMRTIETHPPETKPDPDPSNPSDSSDPSDTPEPTETPATA